MTWAVPKVWQGGDVWILGGGPSIFKQFKIPHEIVMGVMEGTLKPSIYSPYMVSIHEKHIIGINIAYKIGNWIDMVFFGDSNFFLKNKNELYNWEGIKICCSNVVSKYDWVKYILRDKNAAFGISKFPHCVAWNGNSGAAAISIAANTGAKRIFLLGFDMKLDGGNFHHWHNEYGTKPVNGNPARRALPFARHLRGFPAIKKDALAMGIQIINVNPDSAIEEFEKMTLKEALNLQ
jgi:hypothetical protein